MFNGGVDALVCVARDQREVLPQTVQSAAVEHNLRVLEKDMLRRETAMHDVVAVELRYGLGQLQGYLQQFSLTLDIHNLGVQVDLVVFLDEVDDLPLAEVGYFRERLEVEFVPQGNLVLDVLEDKTGDLMLGDADEVVLAFVPAPLADPDGVDLVHLQILQIPEVGQPHFVRPHTFRKLLLLLQQGILQI